MLLLASVTTRNSEHKYFPRRSTSINLQYKKWWEIYFLPTNYHIFNQLWKSDRTVINHWSTKYRRKYCTHCSFSLSLSCIIVELPFNAPSFQLRSPYMCSLNECNILLKGQEFPILWISPLLPSSALKELNSQCNLQNPQFQLQDLIFARKFLPPSAQNKIQNGCQ